MLQNNVMRQEFSTQILTSVQCLIFAVLYGFWNYPQTNFLADLCLILGSFFSLFFLIKNKKSIIIQNNISIYLLTAFYFWIIAHLLLFSYDYISQLKEFSSIWKRVFLASLFGLGFGAAIRMSGLSSYNKKICFVGLTLPVLIFLIKYLIGWLSSLYELNIPEFLSLFQTRTSVFYIPKPEYTIFFVPSFAVYLINIYRYLCLGNVRINYYVNLTLAISTLLAFYFQNNKNGLFYSSLMMFLCFYFLIFHLIKRGDQFVATRNTVIKFLMYALFILFFLGLLYSHIARNHSWITLASDFRVAIQIEAIDLWKYQGEKGYPGNDLGQMVSVTNYERIAWLIAGIKLLISYPLGYGLLESSFSHLGKMMWPESNLAQAHNAWLDFGLGVGVPGLLILVFIVFLSLGRLVKEINILINNKNGDIVNLYCFIGVVSLCLVWFTSEVNFKFALPELMFLLSISIGLTIDGLGNNPKLSPTFSTNIKP
jgi:hypothetical protein